MNWAESLYVYCIGFVCNYIIEYKLNYPFFVRVFGGIDITFKPSSDYYGLTHCRNDLRFCKNNWKNNMKVKLVYDIDWFHLFQIHVRSFQ